MSRILADLFHGRDNNFNLIRFLAASAVLVDHSFTLVADKEAASALVDMEALEIGRVAVDVFFVVSGFLVTRSVMTQPTLVDYGVARVLRLLPALFVVCVAVAFLLGPLVTLVSLGEYFSDERPWLYVPLTTSLITHSLTLPGVFDTVPEAGIVNSPLWTLRYESFCYLLLALFAAVGMLASRRRAGLTLVTLLAFYFFVTFGPEWREQSPAIDSTTRFIFDFFLGGAFYLFADKIRLRFALVVLFAGLAALAFGTPLYEAAFRLALGYGVLWFALVPGGAIRGFNFFGDYSYGLYIICFPLQQSVVLIDPSITPLALLSISFPAVLGLAILSWHFIEHPALTCKAWAGQHMDSAFHSARDKLFLTPPTSA